MAKTLIFDLRAMQKKGAVMVSHQADMIIGVLVIVLLASVVLGTIFGYLGSQANGGTCYLNVTNATINATLCNGVTYGLGNATANPSVPTWLPTILIVGLGIGTIYVIFRSLKLIK